jgi:urea transporter
MFVRQEISCIGKNLYSVSVLNCRVVKLGFEGISLVAPNFNSGNPLLDIFHILFNGISEVPLISSALCGILILVGVLIASRKAGSMMVLSGLIGAAVALILGAPYTLVTAGLFGYNSILTGMAFWSGPFTKTNKTTFLISVIGAAFTAIIWMTFAHVFGDVFTGSGFAIPGFTASFIFSTWLIMYATKRFGLDIWPKAADKKPEPSPEAVAQSFKWTPKEFIKAVLNGVSQVTFIENWKTGLMWVIALTLSFELVSGRIFTNAYTTGWDPASPLFLAGAMAVIGSAIGVTLAILTKLPTWEIRGGIHGFNQVLVMIALTSFLPLTWQTFLYAVVATIVCSLFTMPALQHFFSRWDLPALTGPFVFTTWAFLLAMPFALNIPAGIGWGRP